MELYLVLSISHTPDSFFYIRHLTNHVPLNRAPIQDLMSLNDIKFEEKKKSFILQAKKLFFCDKIIDIKLFSAKIRLEHTTLPFFFFNLFLSQKFNSMMRKKSIQNMPIYSEK